MASGQFHGMVSITAGLVAGGALYYATRDIVSASALGGACMAGVILSPDLDEPNPTRSHTEVRHSFGLIVAAIWWIFWQPYTLIVHRHRSLLSHLPILSTAGRVGYLGTFLIPMIWILTFLWKLPAVAREIAKANWIGMVVQPIWGKLLALVPYRLSTPGINVWVVFLVAVVILIVLSILKVDLPQQMQGRLFWGMMIVIIGTGAVWAFIQYNRGGNLINIIPIGGWLFTGLCISDILHSCADWYMPIWI
jgi:uncharacterized metal-binding protein